MATRPWTGEADSLSPSVFRDLLDATLDIVAVYDREGRVLFINRAVERVLGYERGMLVGRVVFDFFHPDDRERARARFEEVAATPVETGRTAIYRLRASDGSYRHLEALSANRLDDPDVGGICMVVRDVTERVAHEEAQAVIVERRRLAARIARLGVWEWDPDTDEIIAEEAVRQLARRDPGETWTGREDFLARFLPEDRGRLERALLEAAAGGSTADLVVRMPLPDGSLRWLYVHAEPRPPGARRLLGLIMDISARKQAEEQVSRRTEMLSLAAWGAGMGVWEWYPDADRIVNDQSSAELIGLPGGAGERTDEEWERAVHPDDLPELHRLEQRVLSGEADSFQCAYRARHGADGWHWIFDRGRVSERDADGRAVRIVGVALDFDEAKQRELELAEQRMRLDLALSAAELGLWDLDNTTGELYVDERYSKIVRLSAEQVHRDPRRFVERLHPQEREAFLRQVTDLIAGRQTRLRFEGRMLREDRRLGWIRVDGSVVRVDAEGRPTRLIGTVADVTERRRTEQLTRMGELAGQVGSYEFDIGDDRFYWSEGTYRVFEYPDDFVPVRGATRSLLQGAGEARMVEAFRAARERGQPFDVETKARTARGREIWVRIIGRAEMFEGRPVRVYGIVQDISERRRLEAALIDASNREQQRFGSELHDGLGQELSGIALMLQGLAQQVGSSQPSLAEPFRRVNALLSRAIGSARALAHGLAPVSTGRRGLAEALDLLAERYRETFGVEVSFETRGSESLRLGDVAADHLYRIAQEAVSNAARHGRAGEVLIRLETRPGTVMLTVADNGVGIEPGAGESGGLGLRSMDYRARALEGSLSVERRAEGGTLVRVECPEPPP